MLVDHLLELAHSRCIELIRKEWHFFHVANAMLLDPRAHGGDTRIRISTKYVLGCVHGSSRRRLGERLHNVGELMCVFTHELDRLLAELPAVRALARVAKHFAAVRLGLEAKCNAHALAAMGHHDGACHAREHERCHATQGRRLGRYHIRLLNATVHEP